MCQNLRYLFKKGIKYRGRFAKIGVYCFYEENRTIKKAPNLLALYHLNIHWHDITKRINVLFTNNLLTVNDYETASS